MHYRFWLCVTLLTALWTLPALAVECPKDAKSCRVLVLTDEQVKTIELMLRNTCVSGPYSQIKDAVTFYLDLLAKAPAGEVPEVKK